MTRNIALLFAACFLIIVVYVLLFSLFTIQLPQAKRSIVVGYQCLANARLVYGADCPFLISTSSPRSPMTNSCSGPSRPSP